MTTLPRNLTAAALSFFASAVLAVGADDSDPPEPTETTTECAEGQVWDDKSGACVKADSSSLDDDVRYRAARELAHAGRYDEAAAALVSLPGIRFIKPRLGQRTVFRRSFSEGLAVFELDPRSKSAQEWNALTAVLFADIVS